MNTQRCDWLYKQCNIVTQAKKGPSFLTLKRYNIQKKSRAKNVIAKVIRAVAKVYSCKKNWGVTGTLRIGKRLAKHALDGKKHGRIEDELSHSKCHFCFDIRALWRALSIATLNHQVLKNQQQSFNNQGETFCLNIYSKLICTGFNPQAEENKTQKGENFCRHTTS